MKDLLALHRALTALDTLTELTLELTNRVVDGHTYDLSRPSCETDEFTLAQDKLTHCVNRLDHSLDRLTQVYIEDTGHSL